MAPDDVMVFPAAFLPGLVTYRFEDTWTFYTEILGFKTVQHLNGFVRLQHSCGAILLVTEAEQGDTPAELVSATASAGWWLTLEVGDVQLEQERLSALGLATDVLPAPLRWHREAFAIRDPNGLLVVVAARPSRVRSQVVTNEPFAVSIQQAS